MACGGFFSPSYFLLLFCSLFRLSTLPCNVPHDPRPHRATAQNSHHGNGWTVLSTNLRHAHMSPPEEFITSSLQRGHGPCVHTLKKAMRVTPCCREICKENSHWTPPITSSPPPTTTVFWNFNPSWVFFRYPLTGSATSNTMACTNNSQTVLCSTFSSPSTNFPPRFFSLTSSPSLGVESGWVTLCSFSPPPSLLTFVTSICRSFRSSTSLNFSQNCPMLSSPSFQRRGSETTSSSFILRVFLLSPQLQSPFPAKPHPSNLPTM